MESKRNRTAGETQSLAAVVQNVSLKSSDGFVGGHVKLNVGGRFFCTSIDTLTKIEETMLSTMFSGRMELQVDADGRVFIDRSGKHFDTILNYLRDGDVPLPTSKLEVSELLAEANYYCITSLKAVCEEQLNGLDIPKSPVLLLSSAEEWDRLLETTSKPIVRLIVSKYCDDYAYERTFSFNRIALEWNDHFLFVYDTITKITITPQVSSVFKFYSLNREVLELIKSPYEGEIYDCLLRTLRSFKK